MGNAADWQLTVDAEVRVPAATAQLVRVSTDCPTDLVMIDRDAYYVDLCLTPRAPNARACYRDHWGPDRFRRLGKLILLPPGETVRTCTDDRTSTASVVCHIRPKPMLEGFEGELQWTDRRLEASLDIADPNIRHLLVRLAQEMRQPGFATEVLVELVTAQLAFELGRYFANFTEIPVAGELAPWRLRLIDERLRDLSQAPTLVELAALCKLSVRQLTRGFRASRDCSIGDYVANSRIDNAKRMLAGHHSVKAVSYSLGFSSPSGFCAAFRRAVGMTPREYRRRLPRAS
jgi:AraC family transcriptional regulator